MPTHSRMAVLILTVQAAPALPTGDGSSNARVLSESTSPLAAGWKLATLAVLRRIAYRASFRFIPAPPPSPPPALPSPPSLPMGEWEQIGDTPYIAHHAFAFSLGGYGYVMTGTVASGDYTDQVLRYDAGADSWSLQEPFPGGARGYATGDTSFHYVYFGFGLASNGAPLKDLWQFDGDEWTRLADCDCNARMHPALVVSGERIYVGAGGGFSGNLNDWWSYGIATDAWTQLAPVNGPVRHHPFQFRASDSTGAERPFVLFGHGDNLNGAYQIFDTTHRYDPDTDAWTQMAQLPAQGRVAGTQFSHAGSGYVLSGEGEDHRSMEHGEFWRYTRGAWTELPPHPGRSRWAPSSFVLGGYAYLLNGVVRQSSASDAFPAEAYRYPLSDL